MTADSSTCEIRLGILPWNQATDWPTFEATAVKIDRLGYDHIWAWDHLYAIFGDPYQPLFEGWSTLAAWAKVTATAKLGLLVGANTFRNPGLVAKLATTLDHMSGGRAILGAGGAWFELEHRQHGIDFGRGFGERLDRLDEAVAAMRALLAGEVVTSKPGAHYRFDGLRHHPLPIQPRLPIMIGGSGEKKTLRTVARYADMWNGMGTLETIAHKTEVLLRHCEEVGRDPAEIEWTLGCKPLIRSTAAEARRAFEAQMAHNRTPLGDVEHDHTFWYGTPDDLAERMRNYSALGFNTFIGEFPAPFDDETIERWIGEVKPMVEAG
jgi:alkanesulfonate monooxygenase SsuD/methylene tetrahydromethanopterin reductase-like flavin-dependent oxidoreductase (luciferase family)